MDESGERVILIQDINKAQLQALVNAFGINSLLLLEMEISQKINKVVPYTDSYDNRAQYTSDSGSELDSASADTKYKKG